MTNRYVYRQTVLTRQNDFRRPDEQFVGHRQNLLFKHVFADQIRTPQIVHRGEDPLRQRCFRRENLLEVQVEQFVLLRRGKLLGERLFQLAVFHLFRNDLESKRNGENDAQHGNDSASMIGVCVVDGIENAGNESIVVSDDSPSP
jgi:hypothetical protein